MTDSRTALPVDTAIGLRVRTRRLEVGMSQERLAELLNVTFQQVQKYEKGVNRIACSRLVAIAAALDMPAGRFFEGLRGDVATPNKTASDDILATPEGQRLLAVFAAIKSVKVRRRVIDLIEAMAEEAAEKKL